MKRRKSIHSLQKLQGTSRECGRQYGQEQAEAIEAFLHMEAEPDEERLRYAGQCWKLLKKWQQPVVDFVGGMAEGSKLSVEELTLLLLHEEIAHTGHCTAIGATGAATKDGNPIIGENWDWKSHLYAWPSLLRLYPTDAPRAIHYAYPGLWAAAGINEHGLSLVWTSAGYKPKVAPVVGIPTYALVAGILGCATCREAIALIKRTKHAGCFIFFLADATGEVWVIEGLPGKIEVVTCEDVISRGNFYQCKKIARLAKQDPRFLAPDACNRGTLMASLAEQYRGRIDRAAVEKMLRDECPDRAVNICRRPKAKTRGMSIDSFYCLPKERQFWIARGVPSEHEYRKYTV